MTTKMELFLLILCIAVTLLVLTAFDRVFALPFLRSSKREARDLLVALEDLLLPMGSFPSKLLHPWASAVEDYRSDTTALTIFSTITPIEVIKEEEPQEQDSTAAMEEAWTETQAFEKAIRELVDPEGKNGPDLQTIIELVAGTIERRTEVEEGLRCETARFKRALEDQAHEWKDIRGVLDRVINGQNAKLRLTQYENGDLHKENEDLHKKNEELMSENARQMAKNDKMKDQYNQELKRLNAAKVEAEQAAERAKDGVEGRIDELKKRYNKEKSDTEQKNKQEKNTIICSKNMVEDDLRAARRQTTVVQQRYDTEIRNKDSTIHQLRKAVRQLELSATVPEKLAASTEKGLRKQLDDQRKAKDGEIGTLKIQLRESEGIILTLRGWKAGAEAAERNRERLSNRLQHDLTTLRGDKDHIIDKLKLEQSGLKRAIEEHEATIEQQEGRILELESGKLVDSLKRQLGETKKQLRNQKQKTEKTKEDAENCRKEEVRKEGEQRKELSRKLKQEKEKVVEAVRKATEDASEKERQHEKAKNEAVKKAVENAVREATEDANEKTRQLEQAKNEEAVRKAVEKAKEDARQKHQRELEAERTAFREAQGKAIQAESGSRSGTHVLSPQVEKVTESRSTDPVDPQTGNDANELTVLKRESREGYELLAEIGRNGVFEGSIEYTVFQELISAKNALQNIKIELQKSSHAVASKKQLASMINRAKLDEQYIGQTNSVTQATLVEQAKAANARLKNLENILKTNDDVQKEAMLKAIDAPNPFEREVRKARKLKRHTQPEPGMFPSGPSTDVQAGHTMGRTQQKNENLDQQYDPRLFNLEQNVQPQLPTAMSQDHAQEVSPVHLGGAPNGSAFQSQPTATFDFMSTQGASGSADIGSSFPTLQNKGDQRRSTPIFEYNAIDNSDSTWKGINFSKQNEATEANATQGTATPQGIANAGTSVADNTPFTGFQFEAPLIPLNNAQNHGSIGQPTDSKTDDQSFPDIMASSNLPGLSDTATTAVITEPISQNNNASSTGPADLLANNSQTLSLGGQLPLPGLRDDEGTTGPAFATPSQRPKNKIRARRRVNASNGGQLANQAFSTGQSVPTLTSTQGQQSGTQQQVVDIQQGSSGGPSQQEHRSGQPKGWTDLVEDAVIKELRQNNDANLKYLGDFLRLNYDFETSDIRCLNDYLEKLRTEAKAKQSHSSDQPEGWTALMTSFVQDQLKRGQTNTERIITLLTRTHDSVSTIEGARDYVEKLKSEYENPVPKMPAGWTDSMTMIVRDGLQNGDDMAFTEELIKAELEPQPDDDDENFQNWLKKIESDYKAELEHTMQQG